MWGLGVEGGGGDGGWDPAPPIQNAQVGANEGEDEGEFDEESASASAALVDFDALDAWEDQLRVESAAAGPYFEGGFAGRGGVGRRKFARDGPRLCALAHAGDWDALLLALEGCDRAAALATEESTGFTALHRAFAAPANAERAKPLHGANIPPPSFVERAVRLHPDLARAPARGGMLPLHVAAESSAPYCAEAARAWRGAVEALVAAHPDAAATPDRRGATPLHLGIYKEWFVRIVLEHKPMAASVRTGGGDLPVSRVLNDGGEDLIGAMLRAHPDAVFERPVKSSKNLLLAHACREGARCDVLRTILRFAGPAQFKIVDQTNPLFQFWRRMCIIGQGHFQVGSDNWRKAELLTKVASGESADVQCDGAYLLHAAAGTYSPLHYVQMIAARYPHQLRERDDRGRLPLTIAASASTDMFSFYPKLLNMEFERDLLADEAERQKQQRQRCSCLIELFLDLYPSAASAADSSGRVPLCSAIVSGKTWTQGIKQLVQAAPEALEARDLRTHLYPCMLAAVGSESCIDTVFRLLLLNPEVLSH